MFEGLLQPTHLIIILILALVFFGPSKLPELGSSLGKSIREFKRSQEDIDEIKQSVKGSVDTVKHSVDSVTHSVTSAVALEPVHVASRPVAVAPEPAPLPSQPEPRHEGPITLPRQEID
ncbi:MAG TPA: twin-arginine translocase TatA/TatE family subunit [Thermomicrobiales bacterium]|nr:twin-arginine translocase TatA/TatE family subunit [Thermomicrobiales bacterium]